MQGMIGEIRAVAEMVFLGGNWVFLGMVIVASLIAAVSMRNITQLVGVSIFAMLVMAVIWLIFGVISGGAFTDPATYVNQLNSGLASFGAMSAATLIGYLVTFAIVVTVLFLGKSLLFRG